MDKEKAIELCNSVIKDCEKDVNNLEGGDFSGENVETMFGYQAAAIVALAKVCKKILEEVK